jgi:hypothetical protein
LEATWDNRVTVGWWRMEERSMITRLTLKLNVPGNKAQCDPPTITFQPPVTRRPAKRLARLKVGSLTNADNGSMVMTSDMVARLVRLDAITKHKEIFGRSYRHWLF